jgi:hypothetical protein
VLRYYEILQLKLGASPLEIQQAYRDLVRVWHPDRFAHDPRLQKIAEQRLKEINTAYIALEKLHREAPLDEKITFDRRVHSWPRTSPRSWGAPQPGAVTALWFAILLTAISVTAVRLYAFWNAPMRALAFIGEDARRHIALWAGPSLADAFYGWNGIVPQSMDRFVGFYEATAPPDRRDVKVSRTSTKVALRSDPSAGFRAGIGEIQVHNRTDEDTVVLLTTKRARSFTLRKTTVAPQGDVTLGGLGSDLYMVDVTFPNGRRPQMRLGPFVMVQTETAAEKTADRYEITLKPN